LNKWKFDRFTDKRNSVARCRKSPIEVDEIDAEDEQVDETDNDLSTGFRRQEEGGQCQQRNHFKSLMVILEIFNEITSTAQYTKVDNYRKVEPKRLICRKKSSSEE
jgi:hypothetical protein